MNENTTMLKELYTTVTTNNPTDQQLDMLNTAFHNLHVRDALIMQAMRHDIPFDLFTAMAEHPRQMESAVGSIMDAMVNGGRYVEAHARGFLTLLGRMADRPSANAQTYAVTAYLHWFLHDDAGETMDSLLKALQNGFGLLDGADRVRRYDARHPSQPTETINACFYPVPHDCSKTAVGLSSPTAVCHFLRVHIVAPLRSRATVSG